MSWHFLQGREEASWAESSLVGAPSALLSLLPIPEASCSPDSETDSLSPSQSGMMSEPFTESLGAEKLMSSAGDSPAKTSVRPEKEQESPGLGADCGRNL